MAVHQGFRTMEFIVHADERDEWVNVFEKICAPPPHVFAGDGGASIYPATDVSRPSPVCGWYVVLLLWVQEQ